MWNVNWNSCIFTFKNAWNIKKKFILILLNIIASKKKNIIYFTLVKNLKTKNIST